MRKGQNPQKGNKTLEPPARITVGVLNYIPDRIGYYEQLFDVLKLCLASLRAHTQVPFDLMVVDNGSEQVVIDWLQAELNAKRIDYLILNRRNIGKPNALHQVLHSAPGDLVFYTDGDIFFRPQWLEQHLAIMETYPQVGMVAGVPVRNLRELHTESTYKWIEANRAALTVEEGDLIPNATTQEFLNSIGADNQLDKWQTMTDTRITYQETPAYVGATHMQFLTSRAAIQALAPVRTEAAMGMIYETLDSALDNANFLRLSTTTPVVYHIGNTIQESWLYECYTQLVGNTLPPSPPQVHSFWQQKLPNRFVRHIYKWSYKHFSSDVR